MANKDELDKHTLRISTRYLEGYRATCMDAVNNYRTDRSMVIPTISRCALMRLIPTVRYNAVVSKVFEGMEPPMGKVYGRYARFVPDSQMTEQQRSRIATLRRTCSCLCEPVWPHLALSEQMFLNGVVKGAHLVVSQMFQNMRPDANNEGVDNEEHSTATVAQHPEPKRRKMYR